MGAIWQNFCSCCEHYRLVSGSVLLCSIASAYRARHLTPSAASFTIVDHTHGRRTQRPSSRAPALRGPTRERCSTIGAEVSAALDLVTERGKLLATQAGVYRCDAHRCDLFFVTLEKDARHFTPTTLYHDYAISPTLFHWQSQSVTREDSETGRRYRRPPEGWRLLLFVRKAKQDDRGVTQPFLLLGPVHYVSHEGERPMSITWRLQHAVPGHWFQQVKIAAG